MTDDSSPGAFVILWLVLGLKWDQKTDTLTYAFETIDIQSTGTLEFALHLLASAYDPRVWISPCLLELKLFIQSCWKTKLGWDDPLSP